MIKSCILLFVPWLWMFISYGWNCEQDEIDQIVNEIDSLLRKLYEILIGPEIGYGLREAMKMLGADYTLVFVPHEVYFCGLPFTSLPEFYFVSTNIVKNSFSFQTV